jgi:hypothetical protein
MEVAAECFRILIRPAAEPTTTISAHDAPSNTAINNNLCLLTPPTKDEHNTAVTPRSRR